ncbi:MAG: hypothetical protein HY013_22005 [Candidatus Solibacter usitatus]|nr:hypothetical protein [Candidatus Solibacter usitatus]
MRHSFLLGMFALALAFPAPAQKRIADQREYELFQRATSEASPLERIASLLEWEAAYPNTGFQRERILMFAAAYKDAGQLVNAFNRATQLLKLDPANVTAMWVIASAAPALPAPTSEQIKTTEDAANHLLSRARDISRAAVPTPVVPDAAPQRISDPETERLAELLREWRRARRIRDARGAAGMEQDLKAVAERALTWAKSPPL